MPIVRGPNFEGVIFEPSPRQDIGLITQGLLVTWSPKKEQIEEFEKKLPSILEAAIKKPSRIDKSFVSDSKMTDYSSVEISNILRNLALYSGR